MPEDKKPISDVEEPGKSAPSATSKPVLVGNRPLLKDPMVVDNDKNDKEAGDPAEKPADKQRLSSSEQIKLEPLSPPAPEPEAKPTGVDGKPVATMPTADEAAKQHGSAATPPKKPTDEAALAEARLKHQAAIEKLADSKQYALPVNAVEQRRNRRAVIIGATLTVVLVLAWLDIALDAHLISLGGLPPVTHFFSN